MIRLFFSIMYVLSLVSLYIYIYSNFNLLCLMLNLRASVKRKCELYVDRKKINLEKQHAARAASIIQPIDALILT